MTAPSLPEINARGYARPEVLVSTDWLAAHLDDPNVRVIESNEDPLLYPSGHIRGAVQVDWARDLNDPLTRDYLDRPHFEQLMSSIGVTNDTTVVFYGDKSNWWACYAFWVFQLFGHTKAMVLDGGRLKWEKEGRDMTRETPKLGSIARLRQDQGAGVGQRRIGGAPPRQAVDAGAADDRLGGFGFAIRGQHRTGEPALGCVERSAGCFQELNPMTGARQGQGLPEPENTSSDDGDAEL